MPPVEMPYALLTKQRMIIYSDTDPAVNNREKIRYIGY